MRENGKVWIDKGKDLIYDSSIRQGNSVPVIRNPAASAMFHKITII